MHQRARRLFCSKMRPMKVPHSFLTPKFLPIRDIPHLKRLLSEKELDRWKINRKILKKRLNLLRKDQKRIKGSNQGEQLLLRMLKTSEFHNLTLEAPKMAF